MALILWMSFFFSCSRFEQIKFSLWVSPFPLWLGIILGIMQWKNNCLVWLQEDYYPYILQQYWFQRKPLQLLQKINKGHHVVSRLLLRRNYNHQRGEKNTTAAKRQSVEEDVDFFHHKITNLHTFISLEVAAVATWELWSNILPSYFWVSQ